MESPTVAAPDPSIEGGSIDPATSDAQLVDDLQAEIAELMKRKDDLPPLTFAVVAWAAGFALTQALERAWRARGVPEREMNCRFLSIERRRQGARPDA